MKIMRRLTGVTFCLAVLQAASSPADALYQTHLDDAGDWSAEGHAEVAPYGRTGSCLRISTYAEGGERARWSAPKLAVTPGPHTVSAWTANNLAFTQDPGYGAVLAAVLYDADGRELRRLELLKEYKRPHRDKYDFYAIPAQGGLPWTYVETGLDVPAAAAQLQLVFTWAEFTVDWRHTNKNVIGEVYLDDLIVRRGEPARAVRQSEGDQPGQLPYQLRVNTPVSSNVFLKGDPLEFTVRLDGENGPPPVESGMRLRYRVEDFQRLLIDQGEVALTQPYQYWRQKQGAETSSLLKTLYLGGPTGRQSGRWMAIRVTIEHGDRILARGENAFTVTDPRRITLEQMRTSHFWGSGRVTPPLDPQAPWGPAPRLNVLEKQGMFGVRSHGWDISWDKRQPTRDAPIDFSQDHPTKDYPVHSASRLIFAFEERNPLRSHWLHYTQGRKRVPEWALAKGRSTKDDDFIDAEAYARYVEAYVRHTNATVYYTTSPEGGSIERFPKMARAAYSAVKRVDPRLQVAAQVNYLQGKALAEELCSNGLIDYADILVFDNYTCRQGASCREFRNVLEQRGKHKQYWIQEYCYTGSLYQEERTRRMVDYTVWALAHGIDKVRWYANHWITPTIRSPLPSSGVVYGMNGLLEGQGEKLSAGMTTLPRLSLQRSGYASGNYFPYLQWCMHYQLQQHFAVERPRQLLDWGQDIEGALFDGAGYSTAAVWRLSRKPSEPMIVDCGDTAFTATDMYGRQRPIVPIGGKALLTIGEDPLLFRFDGPVQHFSATPSQTAIRKSTDTLTGGSQCRVDIQVVNQFGGAFAATVALVLDDSWQCEPRECSVALSPGQGDAVSFTVTAPPDAAAGSYPLTAELRTHAGVIGWLNDSIRVSSPIEITLAATPYTRQSPAAVLATVRNNTAAEVAGVIHVDGDLGAGWTPVRPQLDVSVPAHQSRTVEATLAGWIPNMNVDYETSASFTASSGEVCTGKRFLSFRAATRRKRPVAIDGNPEDWNKQEMVPYDFFRIHGRGGASWGGLDFHLDRTKWHGPEDASAQFYVQWDDRDLYFLFEFQDDEYIPGGKGVGIWSYDALHFLLYPFAVQRGEKIKGTNYREHIGLDQDGQPTYDRCQGTVGNWSIGSGRPPGVRIAVQPSADGVVMEFAVPFEQFAPLEPRAGSTFALSLMYYDRDRNELGDGIAWYYALTNVDSNPSMFGNIRLCE